MKIFAWVLGSILIAGTVTGLVVKNLSQRLHAVELQNEKNRNTKELMQHSVELALTKDRHSVELRNENDRREEELSKLAKAHESDLAKFQKQTQLKEEIHNGMIAQLRKDLLRVKTVLAKVEIVEVKVAQLVNPKSPADILKALIEFVPDEKNKRKTTRQLIHNFVSLENHGKDAIQVIGEFLDQDIDRELFLKPKQDNAIVGPVATNGLAGFTDIQKVTLPLDRSNLESISMRLGLMRVLGEIGEPESEKILLRALRVTARGVEIAFLDELLEKMAPGKYRKEILGAAKEILASPPPPVGENASPVDRYSENYLYAILLKHKDASFMDTAKKRIITPKGRIDRTAANYLAVLLGTKAVPLFYAMMSDKALKDDSDKRALSNEILKHVGTNPESNKLFKEVIANKETGLLRLRALEHMTGGDLSEKTLRDRLKLIMEIKADSEDEEVNRKLDATTKRIEALLNSGKTNPKD